MNKEAYNYTIRLLSRRDYSRYKLTQKLLDRDYSQEEADEVIEKLLEQRYLREEEYARIRTRQLIEKGHSNSRIVQIAKEEHIESSYDLIESLRNEYDRQSESIIEYLIEKKLRNKSYNNYEEKMKLKQRVARYLLSKGHDFGSFSHSLDQALNSLSPDTQY